MPADRAIDEINGQLYSRADLVREYTAINLNPPEATTLIRFREDFQNKRVLDLGCGTGRLAIYLRPQTGSYVGLDVSAYMVAHCRQRFPELQFIEGDMRSMPQFADGSFDAVLAVFNLLDAVSHADRRRVLAEVRRLLTPTGLFAFSSHNRNFAGIATPPGLQRSRNPLTQLRHVVDYWQARANRRRIKKHERFETEYALLNDSGHNYRVLHYYITRQAQTQQLLDSGFRLLECYDEFGLPLGPNADDRAYCSIHYVARSHIA